MYLYLYMYIYICIHMYLCCQGLSSFPSFHPFETSHGSTACGSQDDWWSQVLKTEKEPELVELRSYIGSQHLNFCRTSTGGKKLFKTFFSPKEMFSFEEKMVVLLLFCCDFTMMRSIIDEYDLNEIQTKLLAVLFQLCR